MSKKKSGVPLCVKSMIGKSKWWNFEQVLKYLCYFLCNVAFCWLSSFNTSSDASFKGELFNCLRDGLLNWPVVIALEHADHFGDTGVHSSHQGADLWGNWRLFPAPTWEGRFFSSGNLFLFLFRRRRDIDIAWRLISSTSSDCAWWQQGWSLTQDFWPTHYWHKLFVFLMVKLNERPIKKTFVASNDSCSHYEGFWEPKGHQFGTPSCPSITTYAHR